MYKKAEDKKQEIPEARLERNLEISIKKQAINFLSKSYGDICLVEHVLKKSGIKDILQKEFINDYKEIMAMAAFMVHESSANYLFPYWHEEHHLTAVKKLNSKELSALCEELGRNERKRINFLRSWGQHLAPTEGIYYDTTSIASYSANIENVEWVSVIKKRYLKLT